MVLHPVLHSLRFPLHVASMLVISSFAVLLWLAENAGLTGLPLLLIVTSWFFKYSFVILDSVIDGHSEPPALAIEMMNPFEQRPLGLLMLLLIGYQLTGALQSLMGMIGMQTLRIALLVVVPAMIAIMGITGRFFSALHPVTMWQLIARMPTTYGLMIIAMMLVWLIPAALLYWLNAGTFLTSVFGHALFMYLWLTMMSLIGSVLYEQRHVLGIEPTHTPEDAQARQQAEVDRTHDRFMDGLFAQCRSGTFDKAMHTVSDYLDQSADPLHEFRWLYARATQWPDQRLAARLVQLCLPRLLEARAHGEVLDCIHERLRASPSFRPDTAAQLIRVVTLARDGGDKATARHLLKDFETHYPNDPAAVMMEKLRTELEQ